MAPIRPLAWESPCAVGMALKRQKKKKKKERKKWGDGHQENYLHWQVKRHYVHDCCAQVQIYSH